MNPNVEVAIIGPFYNGRSNVIPWLESLKDQTFRRFKIYAIDDGSTDGTGDLLESESLARGLNTEVIRLAQNRGPSAARNAAIQRAMSEGATLILLLDNDCCVEPDWIKRHHSFHEKNPDIHLVGGAIAGSARSAIGMADGFCSWFTSVPNTGHGPVTQIHLPTTNLSIKSAVFATVESFDETMATGEDVIFCRQALQKGFKLWLQSDIVATHFDREDFASACRHHYRWGLHSYTLGLQQQGGYYSFLKHLNRPWQVAALVPVIVGLNVLLVLAKYTFKKPKVWFYLPWITILKWCNAMGVYHGYLDPSKCRRLTS